jgi:hypothetical protein
MSALSEKRKSKRLDQQAIIMLEESFSGYYHYATMQNFSGDGMYFEADVPFSRGTDLTIRMDTPSLKSAPNYFVGRVKWCRKLGGNHLDTAYGIGMEITGARRIRG